MSQLKKKEAPQQVAATQVSNNESSNSSLAQSSHDNHSFQDSKQVGYQHSHSDFDAIVLEILNDFDYAHHKEKKVVGENPLPVKTAPLVSPHTSNQILSSHGELLGILGPCGLRGHIAHFYNRSMQIERHVKTEADLGGPKFLEAYHYLRNNPHVEAVFVYDRKMIATHRVNGKLQKNEIAA